MKKLCICLTLLISLGVQTAPAVFAADVSGIWTKTTSLDPNNVTIFYNEKNKVKAIGFSELQGKKIVWYLEGGIQGNSLHCFYHYSSEAIPAGWEQEGSMILTLSDDGTAITGTARSSSGNWSGEVEFQRIQLLPPATE